MCTSSPRIDPPLIHPVAPQAPAERDTPQVVRVNQAKEVRDRKIRRMKNGSLLRSLQIPLNIPNE